MIDFGIAGGGGLAWQTDAELTARMQMLVDLGVKWLRFDLQWSAVQAGGPTSYDWTPFDNIVNKATAQGIKLLGIIDYTPTWARVTGYETDWRSQPKNITDYANFCGETAKRYIGKVDRWEIWNEQNKWGFYRPTPDPVYYTKMLQQACVAIKKYNPSAGILFGGLGSITGGEPDSDPIAFLKACYQAGAKGYFDAVSFHPYSYPVVPSYKADWNAWQRLWDTTECIRSIMDANGDTSKRIWITEYGAPTNGPGDTASVGDYSFDAKPLRVTEELQAAMALDAIQQLRKRASGFGPFFWYSLKDDGKSTDNSENFFGLVRADNSHKPAYDVIRAFANLT